MEAAGIEPGEFGKEPLRIEKVFDRLKSAEDHKLKTLFVI